MSRHAVNTRDTPRPTAVTVTCDNCGGQFTTDETTAYTADQNGDALECKPCQNGQPAPPSKALEDQEVDAIHDDLQYRDGVGPDAEPPVEARLPESIGFSELSEYSWLEVELKKGTKSCGSIQVHVGTPEEESLYLPVTLNPVTDIYDDDVQEAIVSELSKRTQLLIDLN